MSVPRRNGGFSLIEIMITLVILTLAVAAAGTLFDRILTQFRQQSKITETGIESNLGLQILKKDIESAGDGLPWDVGATAYSEAAGNPHSLNGAGSPLAFSCWNSDNVASSDYLVVRSIPIAGNATSRKFTSLSTGGLVRTWSDPRENLTNPEHIVVIRPGPAGGDSRTLNFSGNYSAGPTFAGRNAYAPPTNATTYLVYGLDPSHSRMPFNRADYYISYDNVPSRCAAGTGVLVKAVVSQEDGTLSELPLLDCVADMQVVFRLDVNGNGSAFTTSDTLTDNVTGLPLTAAQQRTQVSNVCVYVLAHEGQYDRAYVHDVDNVYVGDASIGTGRILSLTPGTHGFDSKVLNYRWRLYGMMVRPNTLR